MKRLSPEEVLKHIHSYTELDPKYLGERANSMVEELHRSAVVKTSFQIFDIDWSEERVVILQTDFSSSDDDVIRALADCPQAAISLASLGKKVDLRSSEINSEDALNGMIFDVASAQLLEICVHELHSKIDSLAKSEGLSTTFALIPGLGDFSPDHIPSMLKAVNGERHGVSCAEGFELSPHKSSISLIGLCRMQLTEDPFLAEIEVQDQAGLGAKNLIPDEG